MTDDRHDVADARAERAEQRLRELGMQLLERDELNSPDLAGVVEAVTAQIRREARAGRDVPFAASSEEDRLLLTEGALRGLLRESADDVPGVIVARCGVVGEIDEPDAPIGAQLAVSIAWPRPLREVAEQVRAAVAGAIRVQTGRTAGPIDIEVIDLHAVTGAP